MDRLFDLDVDDEIWQDIRLHDQNQESELPCWMSDDKVRMGIKALLEPDRCKEEEARLIHERRALQVWFSEEWGVVERGIEIAHDIGIHKS